MRVFILAAGALTLATAAHAETVVIDRSPPVVVAPETGGTVVEERGVVVEEANPYTPRFERNTEARERTPNVGDGTSSSRNANQN